MRRLSKYQKRAWMKRIANLPRKPHDNKGEKHPLCRIPDEAVSFIRNGKRPALEDAIFFGITERYVYQIRAYERRK